MVARKRKCNMPNYSGTFLIILKTSAIKFNQERKYMFTL